MSGLLYRCKHKVNGFLCGNRIYARSGNRIVVKRHGRQVAFTVSKDETGEVICEKCGQTTIIRFQDGNSNKKED